MSASKRCVSSHPAHAVDFPPSMACSLFRLPGRHRRREATPISGSLIPNRSVLRRIRSSVGTVPAFCAALVIGPAAGGSGLDSAGPATGRSLRSCSCNADVSSEERASSATEKTRTVVVGRPIRIVVLRGVVAQIERNLLGRPKRLAIVSVSDEGFLMQNAVEDVTPDENLKDHVGEPVTALGALLVRADGTAVLLVESFQVDDSPDSGQGD